MPSEFLVLYSRYDTYGSTIKVLISNGLHLLIPGPKIALAVRILLISELVLVEIPTTVVSLIAANAPQIQGLWAVENYFIKIEVIIYAVTCMAVAAVYLYLAWSKSEIIRSALRFTNLNMI
jgi:hypothetical protein